MSARTASREREYTAPRLYEIAFDMNRKGEVDFLVHCFKRFAKRPVRRVLDIACGTGPHLVRLAERGYQAAGLDLSARNIEYLGERLADKGLMGDLVVGDMTDFRLKRPVDAAICMQDSQGHLLTNAQLLAHLRSVGRNLRKGGLYIFDRYMASSWTNPARSWSWSRRRGGLIVRASFSALNDVNPDDLRDAANQMRDAADAQADVETPEIAQDANDAIVDMLNGFAGFYDDIADRLDKGDSPEDIQADLENDPELENLFTPFVNELTTLMTSCPDSDLSGIFG